MTDEEYMREALVEARKAYDMGEIPIGAVLVHEDQIISRHHNRREVDHDATAHAEVLVIREANAMLERWRLTGCTLYVTIEPCPMCAGAIMHSRIDRLVFGAFNNLYGGIISKYKIGKDSSMNHTLSVVSGIEENTCKKLVCDFFKNKRR